MSSEPPGADDGGAEEAALVFGRLPRDPHLARLCERCRGLVDESPTPGSLFSGFVLLCICVAGVLVGVQARGARGGPPRPPLVRAGRARARLAARAL